MEGAGRLSAQSGDRGAVALLLDDAPIITLAAQELRGDWLAINDDDDLSLAVDFTAGVLDIADWFGRTPTPLRATGERAGGRVARRGVRGWPEVLHDIAVVGANPRERPHLPVSVVVRQEHEASPQELLRDGDNPSEVSIFVAGSEALRLSASAFRGAWLWDAGDEALLNIDSSAGKPGGHLLLTHQISTRWGLH
jgi:hypothetical protein